MDGNTIDNIIPYEPLFNEWLHQFSAEQDFNLELNKSEFTS